MSAKPACAAVPSYPFRTRPDNLFRANDPSSDLTRELSSAFERRLLEDLQARFPFWGRIQELRSVGGGFSGAAVYRVRSERGSFAVKLSPFDRERWTLAGARHEALFAVAARDATLFPQVMRDFAGFSVWRVEGDDGTLQGEASEWLAESTLVTSVEATSSNAEASAAANPVSAFRLLARFHTVARDLPLSSWTDGVLRSPLVFPERYSKEWRTASADAIEAVRRALPHVEPSVREQASLYLNRLPVIRESMSAALATLSPDSPPLRLCLRDVHRRNIHFRGGEAASFFDWDALRFDRRIGDFARLAASYGLSAHSAERLIDEVAAEVDKAERLSAWERTAFRPALATQVWIPPLRWLTWLLVERREFRDQAAARERLGETLESALREPLGAEET